MCNNNNKRKGISLNNPEAHQEDHNAWNRRSFLKTLGLAGGAGLTFGSFSVSAMSHPMLLPMLNMGNDNERILVLIRLKGGNDGLNTIIPVFDYGTYQTERPGIHIPNNELRMLDSAYAIPDTMQNLNPLWNSGAMKVINTVGYDNHNLSHFTSSDIWNAANTNIASDMDQSGWLGRYILNENPDYLENLPEVPGAIKISSGGNITFNNAERIDLAVNFNTPDRLISIAESGLVYDTNNLPDDCYYGDQVGYIRSIMNVTFNYAPEISAAYGKASNEVNYSNNELSRQLAIVARLIKGELGTRLYMVTLDGFDTHENQNQKHPQLMESLANAVSEFYADLSLANMDDKVLSMTFSEFGRRIRESSGGTDHGTAAPVLMFGPALEGNGIFGDDPDLQDVDNNGNLKHSVDFRSVYATVLECWLGLQASAVDQILGGSFDRLFELGINCIDVGTNEVQSTQAIEHYSRPNGDGSTTIGYTLRRPSNVSVSVYSMFGQKLATLYQGYQSQGNHEHIFINQIAGLNLVPLVYKIEAQQQLVSGKFIVHN